MKKNVHHFEAQNKAMQLRGAYLLMHRRFNGVFEPLSLTADQFVLLSLLKEAGECTQRDLADRSFADVNTIGAMLRLLERRKLVRRKAHTQDGRAKAVSLTPAGERLRVTCENASLPLLAALESCFRPGQSAPANFARIIAAMSRGGPGLTAP
jgi:DNA-binding MarR family transcriptional regulator